MGNPNAYKVGFGSSGRTKEFDDIARAKARGVPKKRIWTKEKMHDLLDDMLTSFKKILVDDDKLNIDNPAKLKSESVRDLNNMTNRLLQVMQYLYPPIQQNVNLNIDVTTDAVLERLKNWKQEQIVVIGDETDEKEISDEEAEREASLQMRTIEGEEKDG